VRQAFFILTNRNEELREEDRTCCVAVLVRARMGPGGDPTPDDYTINIHVSSSSIATGGGQDLSVVIDGKKYELACECATGTLLALGDFKAKLVKDEHKTTYDSIRVYEFLFADKKTRRFEVIGQTE
jgi:hypothetical protein